MDYFTINALRDNHAGWSLLRAQNAPLAIAFFMRAFTEPNHRNIDRQTLIDVLDDILFTLRDALGEDKFPRPAAEYLDEWAAPERSWLRKYYVPGQDEPVYDLTAAAEDVVRWVENLRGREFVATQSRRESLSGASNAAAELGAAGDALFASARDAFMTSVHAVGGITVGIAVLIGVLALTNLRHLRPLGAESDDSKDADSPTSVSGASDV